MTRECTAARSSKRAVSPDAAAQTKRTAPKVNTASPTEASQQSDSPRECEFISEMTREILGAIAAIKAADTCPEACAHGVFAMAATHSRLKAELSNVVAELNLLQTKKTEAESELSDALLQAQCAERMMKCVAPRTNCTEGDIDGDAAAQTLQSLSIQRVQQAKGRQAEVSLRVAQLHFRAAAILQLADELPVAAQRIRAVLWASKET